MNRLPKDVAGVDSKPPIASANSATSGKRTSNEAAASGTSVKHKFSRTLVRKLTAGKTSNRAQEEAINLATLLFRLCWLISKREARQKPWYAATLETLTRRLVPYFSPSGVHTMLERLETLGYILSDDKQKPTRYFVTKKAKAEAMDDLIWFDPIIAQEYGGITVAALLHNLHFHLRMERSVNAQEQPFFTLSPRELSKTLPFSESSLKRAKKRLLDDKLIIGHPSDKTLYSVPDWKQLEPIAGSVSEKTKAVLRSMAEKQGSMAENRGSVSEKRGSMADETQRRADAGKRDRKKKESGEKAPPLSPVASGSAGGDATAKSQGNSAHDAGTQHKENDSSPKFISFDQLQELNRANEEVVKTFSSDVLEGQNDYFRNVCTTAVEMLDGKEQKGIWDAQNKDEYCKVLMPVTEEIILGTKHFDHHGVEWDIAYPIYLYGTLELLVHAFHNAKLSKKLVKVTIPEHREVAVAMVAIATKALSEMSFSAGLWQGINSAKAGDPVTAFYQSEISVPEKVKLFTSRVAKWNKLGWMFADGKYRYNLITCADKDLELDATP